MRNLFPETEDIFLILNYYPIMIESERLIIDDILNQIEKQDDKFHKWHVGVTKDIEKELFIEHKVQKGKHRYIIRKATSPWSAQFLESHFLNLGCKGCKSEKEKDAVYVYAYKKNEVAPA